MAETVTFTALRNSLAAKRYAPVYLLHGEEGYYLDELAAMFEQILPEAERDFNLYTLYAPEVEAATVAEACMRYPMMSEYQVVIVKEGQAVNANWLNSLSSYAANPSRQTILAIICRGASVKCAELVKAINRSGGVVYESKKLKESMAGPVIREFVAEKGLHIEEKALAMLQEYVGTDLSRIYNEVGKLTVVLGPGAMITPESIERNIGYSKDYNNFELIAAIARRDAVKAYRIVEYFRRNPKANPTIVTATLMYNFLSNMLVAIYTPDKGDHSLMNALGFKWPGQLTDYRQALTRYNAWQIIRSLDALRSFDARSKGIGSRMDSYDLLQELVFTILNN